MQHTTGTFTTSDHKDLFYQSWLPDGKPVAVMPILHGVGEHSGRYQNFVNTLPAQGIALFSYDQRGEGRSPGQRSHIMKFKEYTDDLDVFLNLVESKLPGVPMFLYGHSMGSLIVMKYILDYKRNLRGVILSGILMELGNITPPILVMIAKIMSRIAPSFSMKTKLDGTSLTRDPVVAQAYMDDPLVHWERSARWGTEILRTVDEVRLRAGEIKMPVLFLHGEYDHLLLVSGAQRIYIRLSSEDKTLSLFPAGLHEPHNDICHAEVSAEICEWIKKRV